MQERVVSTSISQGTSPWTPCAPAEGLSSACSAAIFDFGPVTAIRRAVVRRSKG